MAEDNDNNFKLFAALPQVFYSGTFYKKLSRKYQFWGLVYWSAVLFLVLLMMHLMLFMKVHSFRSPETVQMIKNFPRVNVSLGEVSVNRRLPYQVRYPQDPNRVFVDFLPRGVKPSDADIVVQPDKILLKNNEGSFDELVIDLVQDISISNVLLLNLYNYAPTLIFAISLPVSWLVLSILSALIFLVAAFFVQFITGFLASKCDFKAAYRLTVFATMPVCIAFGVYMLLPLAIPYMPVVFFLILLLYWQFAASNA